MSLNRKSIAYQFAYLRGAKVKTVIYRCVFLRGVSLRLKGRNIMMKILILPKIYLFELPTHSSKTTETFEIVLIHTFTCCQGFKIVGLRHGCQEISQDICTNCTFWALNPLLNKHTSVLQLKLHSACVK